MSVVSRAKQFGRDLTARAAADALSGNLREVLRVSREQSSHIRPNF